jgi:hypothetical protein
VDGDPNEAELLDSARLAARYCDGKREAEVGVLATRGEEGRVLRVKPLGEYEVVDQLL